MEINDDVLINLVRQDNKEAYQILFKKYQRMVAFWLHDFHKLLVTNHLQEDDIIILIMSKFEFYIDQYEASLGHFKKYMKSITERELFKQIKLLNTYPHKAMTTSFSIDENVKGVEEKSYASILPSSYYINEFGDRYDKSTLIDKINDYLAVLNEEERRAYYMYMCNKSYNLIAASLGINPKRVDNIIYKIKKKLSLIRKEYEAE